MFDTVGTRFVDDKDNVCRQLVRYPCGGQPLGQPMPDGKQFVCSGIAFDSKGRLPMPVDHHRHVVVIPRCRGKLMKDRVRHGVQRQCHRLRQNIRGAGDSVVNRLVFALDQAVGEQHQGRSGR